MHILQLFFVGRIIYCSNLNRFFGKGEREDTPLMDYSLL